MTEHEQFINEYCRNVGNIKIRCDDCKFVENCVDYGWQECKKFTPKQSEPMTNEEWFTSLSTEEKAEWLSKHFHCGDCIFEKPMCGGEYDGCKSAFVKWLKEIHE